MNRLTASNKRNMQNLIKAYHIETSRNITKAEIINIALKEFFKRDSDEDVFVKRVETLKNFEKGGSL